MESPCPSVMLVGTGGSKGNVRLQSREFSFKVHASGRNASRFSGQGEGGSAKSDNTGAGTKLERSRIGSIPWSCSFGSKGVMKSEVS